MKNKCLACDEETDNPKYCSRSCAARANNAKIGRRWTKGNRCKNCNEWVPSNRSYCEHCFKSIRIIDWEEITLGEVRGARKYQRNSRVREDARKRFSQSGISSCQICGYDKHIEVHHIKSISSFSEDTPVRIINDMSNLLGLCPNCHWEHENEVRDSIP